MLNFSVHIVLNRLIKVSSIIFLSSNCRRQCCNRDSKEAIAVAVPQWQFNNIQLFVYSPQQRCVQRVEVYISSRSLSRIGRSVGGNSGLNSTVHVRWIILHAIGCLTFELSGEWQHSFFLLAHSGRHHNRLRLVILVYTGRKMSRRRSRCAPISQH